MKCVDDTIGSLAGVALAGVVIGGMMNKMFGGKDIDEKTLRTIMGSVIEAVIIHYEDKVAGRDVTIDDLNKRIKELEAKEKVMDKLDGEDKEEKHGTGLFS